MTSRDHSDRTPSTLVASIKGRRVVLVPYADYLAARRALLWAEQAIDALGRMGFHWRVDDGA